MSKMENRNDVNVAFMTCIYCKMQAINFPNVTVEKLRRTYRYITPYADGTQPLSGMIGHRFDLTYALAREVYLATDANSGIEAKHYLLYNRGVDLIVSHSFSVVKGSDGVFYLIEPRYNRIRGIWAADTEADIFNFINISRALYSNTPLDTNVNLVEYNPLDSGLFGLSMRELDRYFAERPDTRNWQDEIYQVRKILDGRPYYTRP